MMTDQEKRHVVVVAGQSRPHELLLLFFGLIWGSSIFVNGPAPTSLAFLVPTWQVYAWASGLMISGAVGLTATIIRNISVVRSLQIERGAMLMGAGATFVYAFSILVAGGWHWAILMSTGLVTAWTGANLWRAAQIGRDLHRINRAER